jgi:hypothetical protein
MLLLLDRHPETNYAFTLKQGQVFSVLHELGGLARASHGTLPIHRAYSTVSRDFSTIDDVNKTKCLKASDTFQGQDSEIAWQLGAN